MPDSSVDDDDFFDDERHDADGRPQLAFRQLRKNVRRPEQFCNTENSFTLFATAPIFSLVRWTQFATGLSIRMPSNYTLAVSTDPFALQKGVMVISPLPITSLHRDEIQLAVINLWPEKPMPKRQLIIEVDQPVAVVTLVHTPNCDPVFDGWDERAEESWK